MYKPDKCVIDQLTVIKDKIKVTITSYPKVYVIEIGDSSSLELTEEEIEAIYYAMHKLKTVSHFNNVPQEY